MRKKTKSHRDPYVRMLKALKSTEDSPKFLKGKEEAWFLYIVECKDGSLYTGITKDITRRLKMHNEGKGARFTRSRRPVKVIYSESLSSYSKALIREHSVKSLSRLEKEALGSLGLGQ